MKKIYTILISIVLMAFTSGCTDWLDIRPESDVVLDEFWQNETQVNEVLAACYRSLTANDVMSRMMTWGELRSDNVTFGLDMNKDQVKIINLDINTSNEFSHWGSMYTVINYCNIFLHYAPGVVELDQNFTQTEYRSLEAEVLAIRSLAYFYLVRTFKRVPWIETPSIDDNQDYYVEQSDEEVVLDKIIADLETALKFTREQFETVQYTKGRITKNAVRAMLADVYLWRGDFNNSIQYCDQIMNDENLELVDGEQVLQRVFFMGNSPESIFEIQFDQDLYRNEIVEAYYGKIGDTYGEWAFPYSILASNESPFKFKIASGFEAQYDQRRYDFLRVGTTGDSYQIFKYVGVQRTKNSLGGNTYYYGSGTPNWIVYRLSDIILMKAEALVQLGTDNQQVIDLVNQTYMRANYDDEEAEIMPLSLSDYSDKRDFEKLVLRERQRELMFEGKRWFDLMRLARRADSPAPAVAYIQKKSAGGGEGTSYYKMSVMDALYMPVNIGEMNSNPLLEQNPFYEIENSYE
ncbi:MAG: RagB/SusD family nutrient uptake outer membrane protein [Prolixibacteraceae bacterium]|jgi:hypothetical protein|nr:RagB/SusD family nutrient uptake outer membrane protein [Prolixibacteraceae bacterium]